MRKESIMKKTTKRIVRMAALLLSLVLVLSFPAMAALPETVDPQASQYFNAASGWITAKGNGNLTISFDVMTPIIMKKLGVQTIVLYESTDRVEYFPVRVYYSSDFSSMMGSNTSNHSGSVTYSGVARRYYRASFVFTAQTSSGNTYNTTEWSLDVKAT